MRVGSVISMQRPRRMLASELSRTIELSHSAGVVGPRLLAIRHELLCPAIQVALEALQLPLQTLDIYLTRHLCTNVRMNGPDRQRDGHKWASIEGSCSGQCQICRHAHQIKFHAFQTLSQASPLAAWFTTSMQDQTADNECTSTLTVVCVLKGNRRP